MFNQQHHKMQTITMAMPDGNGGSTHCPELLTEDKLVLFLRIREVSSSKDYHNVIEHLKRYRDLPRIHKANYNKELKTSHVAAA